MKLEGTHLNIINGTYDKPTANIMLNGEKSKDFPLISGTMPTLTISILHSIGSPYHSNHTGKMYPNWKL